MDAKTARKYLRARRLPSEMQQKHTWRTRPDPFADVWDELEQHLRVDRGLEAKTLFEYLQEREPDRFREGQLRTLQRRIKNWRALESPPRELFFAQEHYPHGLRIVRASWCASTKRAYLGGDTEKVCLKAVAQGDFG